ncbi:MAG: DUF4124 domain-containing protein [Thiolinea sp.]
MMLRVLVLPILLLFSSMLSAEVYRWTDANGRTVFGDDPPAQIKAKPVELQPLTIADSYDSGEKQNNSASAVTDEEEADKTAETVDYKNFKVTSPAKGEAIRANNGNVLVRLELEPALQDGHGIVVYLDGKQAASGDATTFSLENIDRGSHSLFAVVHDANDEVLKNTESVSFDLLRASVLH